VSPTDARSDRPPTVTVPEAAQRLGISQRTAWRWIKAGTLTAVTVYPEGIGGNGRTVVHADSLARAVSRVSVAAGTRTDRPAPPAGLSRDTDTALVVQLVETNTRLSETVARLTAQLGAADGERRQLQAQLAGLLPAPQEHLQDASGRKSDGAAITDDARYYPGGTGGRSGGRIHEYHNKYAGEEARGGGGGDGIAIAAVQLLSLGLQRPTAETSPAGPSRE
jgi:excisionase family DNA binding protein